MPVKRVACVLIDHLPVQVERTLNVRLAGRPFIVSGLAWKPDSVLDVSPEAVGVVRGMNVRQAKQACPHAQVVPPREELYYSIHSTLVQICEQFFAVCEGPAGALRDGLTKPTSYPGSVQRKVFLLDKISMTKRASAG